MDKSGIENPSKSEVIGHCGGDEKNEWPRRTDKSRTLKKKIYFGENIHKTTWFFWGKTYFLRDYNEYDYILNWWVLGD